MINSKLTIYLIIEIITLQKKSGDEDEPDDAPAEPRPPLADEDPLHPLGQRAQGPHCLHE